MKTPNPSLHNILLAAAFSLPLLAGSGAVLAADMGQPDAAGPRAGHDAAPDERGDDGHGRPGPGVPGGPGGPGQGYGHEEHGPGKPPGMFAFGGPGMGGHAPGLRGVELSEAQQDKVFAILHAQEPYLREQGKAAAKAHEALRAMAKASPYDDAKAASLAQAGAQAMANIELQRVRTEQKLLAVLTPEQRKKQSEEEQQGRPARPARP